MGYEIHFYFREQGEEPGIYEEEVKTKKVKVGTPTEDVPLEQAAGKIMAQLARRNILITDVEIYEFTKKKLSYKEAEDGILIKNKKFSFDDGASLEVSPTPPPEENVQDQLLKLLASNPNLLKQLQQGGCGQQQPHQQFPQVSVHFNSGSSTDNVPIAKPPEPGGNLVPPIQKAPIRYELFDPEPTLAQAARRRGLKFQVGKEYPIYEERRPPDGMEAMGLMYVTVDDSGSKQILSSMHFVPKVGTLEKGFEDEPTKNSSGFDNRLAWDGAYNDAMPSLR